MVQAVGIIFRIIKHLNAFRNIVEFLRGYYRFESLIINLINSWCPMRGNVIGETFQYYISILVCDIRTIHYPDVLRCVSK